MIEVFIPHNVPSLKNSKIATKRGVFPSKTVQNYLRLHGIKSYSSSKKTVDGYVRTPITFPVEQLRELFKGVEEYPVIVGFHFVRNSKRTFDYNNASQILMDLFTAFDLIPDDDCNHVVPYYYKKDGTYYSYNKDSPGVYIKLIT